MTSTEEAYVRRLRDNIYGPLPKHCTEEGWQHCKERWTNPENIIWLENQPQNQHVKITTITTPLRS